MGTGTPMHTVPQGSPIYYKATSKFMKALGSIDVAKTSDHGETMINTHYRVQPFGNLMPALDFNPMWNGRPRKEVNWLLLAAPSPIKLYRQFHLFHYGLVTLEPAIANRRKARCRLSYCGMELLDYWAGKYPKFKPFVDAYLTKKARGEIASDELGYKLGFIPTRFKAMKELHEQEVSKNRNTPNRRKYQANLKKREDLWRQQRTLLYNGQMAQAQAQYQNVLGTTSTSSGTAQTLHPSLINQISGQQANMIITDDIVTNEVSGVSLNAKPLYGKIRNLLGL